MERVRGALIRFVWTWLFAFFAQPAIQAIANGQVEWNWEMAGAASIAAFIYALKKLVAPDSVL